MPQYPYRQKAVPKKQSIPLLRLLPIHLRPRSFRCGHRHSGSRSTLFKAVGRIAKPGGIQAIPFPFGPPSLPTLGHLRGPCRGHIPRLNQGPNREPNPGYNPELSSRNRRPRNPPPSNHGDRPGTYRPREKRLEAGLLRRQLARVESGLGMRARLLSPCLRLSRRLRFKVRKAGLRSPTTWSAGTAPMRTGRIRWWPHAVAGSAVSVPSRNVATSKHRLQTIYHIRRTGGL